MRNYIWQIPDSLLKCRMDLREQKFTWIDHQQPSCSDLLNWEIKGILHVFAYYHKYVACLAIVSHNDVPLPDRLVIYPFWLANTTKKQNTLIDMVKIWIGKRQQQLTHVKYLSVPDRTSQNETNYLMHIAAKNESKCPNKKMVSCIPNTCM